MTFTDQLAFFIKEKDYDLQNLTLILPSERAKKYLSASLFKAYGRPILAPKMHTIDQWVRKLSDRPVIDKTRTLIRLYEVYASSNEGKENLSFSEFMSWGTILLSDYDELDRYMLDARHLFRNLADIREIEQWSFNSEELTEGQRQFMEFWDRLPGYYAALKEKLTTEQVYYMGQAYRYVADNILSLIPEQASSQYIFAGFNALSEAELCIMRKLKVAGRAEVLIDADVFYLDAPQHEAGAFQRKLIQDLHIKEPFFVGNRLLNEPKHVRVVECAQHIGQTRVAATLLSEASEQELNETMVMLADESLVVPMLKSIPKNVGKANITLGMPLKNTAIKTWVDLLFSIQENYTRFNTRGCYHQDIRKWLNHPFMSLIASNDEKKAVVKLEQHMARYNSIFLSLNFIQIGPLSNEVLNLLYTPWENDWSSALRTVRKLNALLFKSLGEDHAFEQAIIEQFEQAMLGFENLVNEGIPQMPLSCFKQLFNQHWHQQHMAYHGNPLKGLQIMGLLETRLLDFKRIIVLGLNEGVMPPTNPIQSLIPMDLRRYSGLPTPREKQGLFAHHFYRMLHQCEEMVVTYSSSSENLGSNEESRYLLQLELELSRLNPQFTMKREMYTIPFDESETSAGQVIAKSPELLSRLDEFFTRSLSASAINKFLSCPLDFCYRYLFEFGEDDAIEEEIESARFGTFIHDVMETLYTPFARHKKGELVVPAPKNLTVPDIDHMLEECEGLMTKAFMKHFGEDASAFASGKNLLSYEMALDLTKRLLKQERAFLSGLSEPLFIEHLEVLLEGQMDVPFGEGTRTLKFKGFIDRIDSIGGKIRIIDYKSGKADALQLKLSAKKRSDLRNYFGSVKHAVQLVLYTYLYHEKYGELPHSSGIYSLINVTEGVQALQPDAPMEEVLVLFKQFIGEILTELYDIDTSFVHNTDSKYCLYCD
jgi:RecB family exonuclease